MSKFWVSFYYYIFWVLDIFLRSNFAIVFVLSAKKVEVSHTSSLFSAWIIRDVILRDSPEGKRISFEATLSKKSLLYVIREADNIPEPDFIRLLGNVWYLLVTVSAAFSSSKYEHSSTSENQFFVDDC